MIPRNISNRSASPTELVLELDDAIAAVECLVATGRRILGWEGWLKLRDGRLGHSALFQGTVDLSELPSDEAAALTCRTMREAFASWQSSSERDAQLLFCITYDGTDAA